VIDSLVSLLFITIIPVDLEIINFSLYLLLKLCCICLFVYHAYYWQKKIFSFSHLCQYLSGVCIMWVLIASNSWEAATFVGVTIHQLQVRFYVFWLGLRSQCTLSHHIMVLATTLCQLPLVFTHSSGNTVLFHLTHMPTWVEVRQHRLLGTRDVHVTGFVFMCCVFQDDDILEILHQLDSFPMTLATLKVHSHYTWVHT